MLKRMLLIGLVVLGLVAGPAMATEFYAKYDKGPECFMSLDYELYQGPAPNVWVVQSSNKLFERKYLREGGDIWRDARVQGEEVLPCCTGGTVSPAWLCPVEPEPAPAPVVLAAAPVFEPKSFVVYFDFDKDLIKADQVATLEEAAAYAKEFNARLIVLDAHCDFRGSDAYNLDLGARRATAVEHWLIENGVTPERFKEVNNFGDRMSPDRIMKGKYCADCWQDRRVEVQVVE